MLITLALGKTAPAVSQTSHIQNKQEAVVKSTAQPKLVPKPKSVLKASTCLSEIKKYSWDKATAYAVSKAESRANPKAVNLNHRTRDHSIGCFQINIYGKLAETRPSKKWLLKTENNVRYAYQLYKARGHTFKKDWRGGGFKGGLF